MKSRIFAYNPTETVEDDLSITGTLSYQTDPNSGIGDIGSLIPWGGPDEDTKYVIAYPQPSGDHPTPIPGVFASLGFKGCAKNDTAFIALVNNMGGDVITIGGALAYINSKEYWSSYETWIPNPTDMIVKLDSADTTLGLDTSGGFDVTDISTNTVVYDTSASGTQTATGLVGGGNYAIKLKGTTASDYFKIKSNTITECNLVNIGDITTLEKCFNLNKMTTFTCDADLRYVTSFYQTFTYCSSLTSIPTGLFDNNTAITSFEYTFFGCSSLTSIPTGLFDSNTAVISFYNTFYNCSSLTSIPTDLFRYNAAATSFSYTFYGCSSLTSIPTDLFRYNAAATNFSFTLRKTSLTSIPTDLFRYNTAATIFSQTFRDCTSLTSIPTGLFDYNIAVTSFSYIFYNCKSLTSIPTGLFDNNTAATSFYQTFVYCTSLTSIPTGLFDYNTAVTNFHGTFYGCSSLTSIPTGLFDYNTAVTNFSSTFYNCYKLQLNRNIFYADGEQTTRFLNKSVNFLNCFNRSSFTGVQGEAPDLWNCDFGTETPTKTDAFEGAGNSLISLSNYASIPVDWI
jgi:hypothetical protein